MSKLPTKATYPRGRRSCSAGAWRVRAEPGQAATAFFIAVREPPAREALQDRRRAGRLRHEGGALQDRREDRRPAVARAEQGVGGRARRSDDPTGRSAQPARGALARDRRGAGDPRHEGHRVARHRRVARLHPHVRRGRQGGIPAGEEGNRGLPAVARAHRDRRPVNARVMRDRRCGGTRERRSSTRVRIARGAQSPDSKHKLDINPQAGPWAGRRNAREALAGWSAWPGYAPREIGPERHPSARRQVPRR